jgi:hypothetical protein
MRLCLYIYVYKFPCFHPMQKQHMINLPQHNRVKSNNILIALLEEIY